MTARAPIDDRAYAAFFAEPSVPPPTPVATAPATPTAPAAGNEGEREVGELYGADRLAKFPKKQVVLFRSMKKAQDAEKVLGDLLVAVAPVNPDATNWKSLSGRSIAAVAAADQVEELAEYAVGVASSLKVVPVADAEWLNGDKADGAALLDMIKTRGVWKKEKPRTDGAKSPAGDNAPKPKEASSSPDAAEQAPVDAPQHAGDGEQGQGGDAAADGVAETVETQGHAQAEPTAPASAAPTTPAPAAAAAPAPAAAPAAVPVAPTRTTTKRDAQAYSDGPVDADRVRDALSFLDPSCDRHQWVQVGMCIKNELGDAGFDVWDQWSRESDKYNQKDAASTWKSIKAEGKRTIASLFGWAKEAGWKPSASGKKWTKAEIEAHKAAQADRQRRQVEESARQHAEDARRLADVRDHWRSGAPDPVDNDYVIKKQGKADGLRSVSWPLRGWSAFKDHSLDGWLMVPAYAGVGNSGDVMSIQFIGPNKGEKLNAPAPIKGYTFTVGELKKGEKAFIVEGIGHAWSMNIVTGSPAVVSFSAGNIEVAAAAVQEAGAIPVIVADRGKEADAARIAARLGCWYAPLPEDLPIGSDVNDLHLARDDDAVRAVVDGAIRGKMPEEQAAAAPELVEPQADRQGQQGKSSLEKAYDYLDANGVILFRVRRLAPNTFRECRPDGHGGWTWGTKGIERVPYRLPQMLANPDAIVYVCAGEEDADALAKLGLVATCSSGGPGMWASKLTPHFAGRRVVILPANSQAGHDHARMVLWKLRGIAAEIRVLCLPGLQPGGSVVGWLNGGGTAAELQRLAMEVPADEGGAATLSPPAAVLVAQEVLDVHDMDPVPQMAWPHLNPQLKPLNTIPNLRHLLRNYGFTVRYDVIRKELLVNHPGQSGTRDNVKSKSVDTVISLCALNYLAKTDAQPFLLSIGDDNPHNPVMDFITANPWDGVSRFDDLLATVETKPGFDRALLALLMRRWLISAVAAAAKPAGFWSKGVLVFQGHQSLGKTSWFRSLMPSALRDLVKVDAHIDPKDKDTVISAVSHWLVELGELDGTLRKTDIARLKGFISQDVDQFRRPWGRTEEKFQRRTVFFASVNPEAFLADDTGNVRWWTIPVVGINHAHGIDMQQVWAEVFTWFQADERWWLDRDEEAMLEASNARHEQADPVDELISAKYDFAHPTRRRLTATQVLQELGYLNPNKKQLNESGKPMRKHFGEPSPYNGNKAYKVPPLLIARV